MKLKLADNGQHSGPMPVIEWSREGLRLYDPALKNGAQRVSAEDLRARIGDRPVVVALGRRNSFVRTARLPDAAKADVARILQLRIDTLFPLASADVAVDFVMTDDRSPEGRLAVVSAAPSDIVTKLHESLPGVTIQRVMPLAVGSQAVAAQVGLVDGAIIEETPDGISIDVVADGRLRGSRVVPNPNSSEEIMAEVHRTFAMLKVEPGGVVAAGGFVLAGATQSTEASALSGLAHDPPELNLEPPQVTAMREQRAVAGRKKIAIYLWMLTAAVVFALGFERFDDMSRHAKTERNWANKLKSATTAKSKVLSKKTKISESWKALERALAPKQPITDAATVFTRHAPEGLWLTGMGIERGKLASIRGTAVGDAAITAYLGKLGEDKRFRDVKLQFANNADIRETPVVNFSISAHIVGNFPLVEDEKRATRR